MTAFWIDIESQYGGKVGTIRTAQEWRQIRRLSRAGEFSFTMPAGDPQAALVVRKRVARCFTIQEGVLVEVGSGIIDRIGHRDTGGERVLSVEGGDLLRELTYRTVGKLTIGGYRVATTNGLNQIKTKAFPPGWTYDTASEHSYITTEREVYHPLNNETALGALAKVSDLTGEYFILGAGRKVRWLRKHTLTPPFRAIQQRATWATHDAATAHITSLDYETDTYEQCSRCYAMGGTFSATNYGPDGEPWLTISGQLTLEDAYREYLLGVFVLPAGFTMEFDLDETLTPRYYIFHAATEASIGRIERYKSWDEIKPVDGFSAAEIMVCSKQLALTACEWLGQRINGQTTVSIGLAGAKGDLLPGALLPVQYRAVTDGVVELNLWDAALFVLEATVLLDTSGLHTVAVQAVDYGRWPRTNDEMFADLADTLRQVASVTIGLPANQFQQTLETGVLSRLLEVRGVDGVPFFRAEGNLETGAESGVFGHPTQHRIEWDRTNGVRIAGSQIAPVLRASATWDPGDIGDTAVASTTITVAGAVAGDTVIASHDQIGANDMIVSAHVQATDTARVVVHNKTGGNLNIGSGTLYVTVFKRP